MASELKYKTIFLEAREGSHLVDLLVPGLRTVLYSLTSLEAAKDTARRGLRVLKSFIGGIKASISGH